MIRLQIDLPLFENVEADDQRYNIMYAKASSRVIVIYPSNTILLYDSETFEVT